MKAQESDLSNILQGLVCMSNIYLINTQKTLKLIYPYVSGSQSVVLQITFGIGSQKHVLFVYENNNGFPASVTPLC